MQKFYSIGQFAKILNVSIQTLRAWDAKGILHPNHITVGGHRYYSEEQLGQITNKNPVTNKTIIGYCRVSSDKQKDDLERQVENMRLYLTAQGKPFEIITDIGSGIDYKKKGLNELLQRLSRNSVEKIVVLHKDRLVHFGFELIEQVATLHGCQIEIVDNTIVDSTIKTEEQELVEDLVQIITIFSYKLQGKRANKTKKIIKELIENGDQHD